MPQSQPRLTVATTVLGDKVLRLHSLTGHEALSEPFRFNVTLVTEDSKPVDLAALLGTVVKVTLDEERTAKDVEHPVRYFNGYVTQVSREILPSTKWLYTVELRPWLWLLDKTRNCRIFQNLTVPEIAAKVFRDRGFTDFDLRLGRYEKREFCVQYRESDLDFVSRLLEHEGIYYYFEFTADKHTLVLTDGSTRHQPKPKYTTIECSPTFIGAPTVESFGGRIYEFVPRQELRAKKYVLRDYDFIKPLVKPEGTMNGEKKMPAGVSFEKYDYPGGYTELPVGNKYAMVRIQEEQVPCERGDGKTTSHGVAPGYVFTMAENNDPAQNKTYLTIRATYEVAVSPYVATDELEPKPWNCEFTVIESSTPFRPARITPRPLIAGLQTAEVVGGSADEIHTDPHGRIKVQFHWDREGKSNESSSCFIRTAQMWAGPNWGSQHIPRIGHEVVVSFLEGDPDRPLIVGSVYNGLNLPPFKLPDMKEVSGVKTRSTLNGGTRYNELSFEDTQGKEVINLRAQRNMRSVVENERFTKVGGDDTEVVEGTQNIAVAKQFITVDQSYTLSSPSTELVCGPTVIKLTPLGIVIKTPKFDIDAPLFNMVSPNAVITPGVFTVPLGLRPPVPVLPPKPEEAPSPDDNIGGKRANATPAAPAGKPDLKIDTNVPPNGMPTNGMPSPPASPAGMPPTGMPPNGMPSPPASPT